MCNRDERRTRAAALRPQPQRIGGRTALFPFDPQSGGTWIGINDARMALVILNRTISTEPQTSSQLWQSRGTIIPRLLRHDTLYAAVREALGLDPTRFDLFRLIALQGSIVAAVTSDGRRLSYAFFDTDRPLMFTSSSLGGASAELARRHLFKRIVVHARHGWRRGQHRFHRHAWIRRPEISVVMNRPDARTVSRTVVDLGPQTMSMRYEPLAAESVCGEGPLSGAA